MTPTVKWILGVVALVLLAWVAVGTREQAPKEINTIRIGALLILSGDGAAWGENAQRGLQMAIDEFNTGSVLKVELIVEDTAGETSRAVSAYRKLVDIDKVDAVVGPLFQTEVATVAPLVAEDSIPVITPSYAPIKNRPNPRNPLMIWMDPTIEAHRMAEYVFNSGIKTVSVIGTLDSWENEVSDAFAKRFEELGGSVISKELVQPDTDNVRVTVTKSLNKNPEAIFIGSYYQFIPITKIIDELQFPGEIFSIEVDSYLAEETAAFTDGLRFIAPDFYTEEFAQRFELLYGQKPGIPAGQAYDATKLLIKFFVEEGGDVQKVLLAMKGINMYEGVSGTIAITNENKTIFPTAVFELQKGEVIKL